jgi:tetratricopeptide (TPR) repeat protein
LSFINPLFLNVMNTLRKTGLLLLAGIFSLNLLAQKPDDGLKYLEAEQYSKAGSIFEANAQAKPTAENLYYLGYYNIQVEKNDAAKAAFDKGIAADPAYPLNYVGLGTLALQRNARSEAKSNFDKAISMTKSKNAEVLYRVGEAYANFPEDEKQRDAAEAIRILEMAAKVDVKNPDILSTLGDAYLIKNDGSNAFRNYDSAIRLNPKLAKSYIKSANVLIRARDYNGALDTYQKGLAADPNYAPGYRQLGGLYFLANQFQKASGAFENYIKLSDNKTDAKLKLGKTYFLSAQKLAEYGKKAESETVYKNAIQTLKEVETPNIDPVIYRLLGYSYYETKDYQPGVPAMETFFAKYDPKKILTSDYVYYGKLLSATGKDSLAIVQLEKAALLDTMDHEILKVIADSQKKIKKFDKAAMNMEKVIARKADKATANDYLSLGTAYYSAKNYKRSDTVFAQMIRKVDSDTATSKSPEMQKAREAGREQARLLANLYRARSNSNLDFQNNGNTPKWLALPFYQKYVDIANASADKTKYKKEIVESYKYIGSYHYVGKNNVKQAVEAWNKGLELDPENADLKQNIKVATAPPAPKTPQRGGGGGK